MHLWHNYRSHRRHTFWKGLLPFTKMNLQNLQSRVSSRAHKRVQANLLNRRLLCPRCQQDTLGVGFRVAWFGGKCKKTFKQVESRFSVQMPEKFAVRCRFGVQAYASNPILANQMSVGGPLDQCLPSSTCVGLRRFWFRGIRKVGSMLGALIRTGFLAFAS